MLSKVSDVEFDEAVHQDARCQIQLSRTCPADLLTLLEHIRK